MTGPLQGVRVVEMGLWVAGPAAGGILADWGAEVIKVEPPGGDPFRRLFANLAGLRAPGSPPFDLDNRGKRSVILDLTTDEGSDALSHVLATADVFLSNYRLASLERLGLGPDELASRYPTLVACYVSGYGRRGPDRDRPGYDVGSFWARSGLAASMTPEGADIPLMRGGMGDHVTGLAAAGGICAALVERARTGRGQVVETSLLRTGIYAIGWDTAIHQHFGKLAPPERRAVTINPMMNPYRAADGRWFWLLGLEADRHWPPTAEACGHPEWIEDPRFATAADRRRNAIELISLLDAEFAGRPFAEWQQRFDEGGVWWAPVQTTAEVLRDPQAVAAGAFVDVTGLQTADGEPAQSVATPVDFGGVPLNGQPLRPVPGPGEHTAEVLSEVGSD
jgi:crotonobetainyl-CoA:carnitine CoA-transferase CaiB-like acyl-CoA transferase